MGKYDLVEQVLEELGAEFFFTGAMIQPGKPVVFGKCPGTASSVDAASSSSGDCLPAATFFFGLPGNPVSTMVTFELFVRPVIQALAGRKPQSLVFLQAKLKTEVITKTGLTRFLPALLAGELEHAEVSPVEWQGSGDFIAAARANCYLVVPSDRDRIDAGEMVSVLIKP
jgi:molybdopterin molybdotransferase